MQRVDKILKQLQTANSNKPLLAFVDLVDGVWVATIQYEKDIENTSHHQTQEKALEYINQELLKYSKDSSFLESVPIIVDNISE